MASSRLFELLAIGPWKTVFRVLFVLIFVLPTLILMFLSIKNYTDSSTQSVLKAKELQGILAATIVAEKTDAQFELGASLATRPLLVQAIERDDWAGAMNVLSGIREQHPALDRIVLYTLQGVIMADDPPAGVVGQRRTDKKWYKEFSKRQTPHLSGVYLRGAEPSVPVVCLVLPVFASSRQPGSRGNGAKPIAILQLQLNLSSFAAWAKTDTGPRGLIYIFDQYGHIVHHPNIANSGEIVDFSSVPIVQKALRGQNGVEINYNPVERETRVAAYRTLPKYGWGVVVTQAADKAFAERDKNIRGYYCVYAAIAVLALLLSLALLYILVQHRATEKQLEDLALLDELTGLHNRRGFFALSSKQLAAADRLGYKLFLVYADLDGMKLINDRFGHQEGDRAITGIAQVIRSTFRDTDIKARIGGDEFVVLGVVGDGLDVDLVVDRLRRATAAFSAQAGRPYELSVSAGAVTYDPATPCSIEELMECGDRLMYQIKAHRPAPAARMSIVSERRKAR